MQRNRRAALAATMLALAGVACADAPPVTEPDPLSTIGFSNGAVVDAGTITLPFPPNPNVTVTVSAPCLGLSTPLVIAGTWVIRYRTVAAPGGRRHSTEYLDYSGVSITSDGLTWEPADNAHEIIVLNLGGGGATTLTHQIRARYHSQNGLADLMVHHSYKVVLRPDGTFVRDPFAGFSADCIGT